MNDPHPIFRRIVSLARPVHRNRGKRFLLLCLILHLAAATLLMETSGFAQNAMSLAQFDSIVFQQQGTAEVTRQRLTSSIDLQIQRIEGSTKLRDDQKRQLQLAGQGDIQRFFNRVVAAQKDFLALDPEKKDFNEAYRIAAPLQMELAAGLFGSRSMFAKVVQATLDEEQLKVHRQQEANRIQQEREAYVRMHISDLESTLPITAEQREALMQLASAQLGDLRPNIQPHMQQLIAYQLFMLPEEKMAEIFDAKQMDAFRKAKARRGAIERMLRQQGVLVDDAE